MTDDDVVILLDQFRGPTPHDLARDPIVWEAFVEAADRGVFDPPATPWCRAQRTTLEEVKKRQPMATTAYRCGENGYTEIVSMRWDST